MPMRCHSLVFVTFANAVAVAAIHPTVCARPLFAAHSASARSWVCDRLEFTNTLMCSSCSDSYCSSWPCSYCPGSEKVCKYLILSAQLPPETEGFCTGVEFQPCFIRYRCFAPSPCSQSDVCAPGTEPWQSSITLGLQTVVTGNCPDCLGD